MYFEVEEEELSYLQIVTVTIAMNNIKNGANVQGLTAGGNLWTTLNNVFFY